MRRSPSSTRPKLKQLLQQLWDCKNEEQTQEIAERISGISPDPNWSDYIFHSDEFVGEDDSLNVEGLMDKIFAFKPR